MIIAKKVEKIQLVQIVKDIQCSKCKRIYNSEGEDMFEFQEIFSFETTGGYGSIFGDGVYFRIDLCQHCFKELAGDYIEYLE